MAGSRGMSVTRDELIAACLVGAVVVVVGYASGLGLKTTTTASAAPPVSAGGAPPPAGVQPAEIPPPPPGLVPPPVPPGGAPPAYIALPPASDDGTGSTSPQPGHPGHDHPGHHPEHPGTRPPTTGPDEPDEQPPADCEEGASWTLLSSDPLDGVTFLTAIATERVAASPTPSLYDDEGRGPLTQTYDALLGRCESGEAQPSEESPSPSSAPHDEHGGS